jgi:hypothetical protein
LKIAFDKKIGRISQILLQEAQIYYHLVIPNAKVAAIGFSTLSLVVSKLKSVARLLKQSVVLSASPLKEKKLEPSLYFPDSYSKALQQIGIITLAVKPKGKHSAGNPHAMFDEAGAGNVRSFLCAPVPDPTDEGELEIGHRYYASSLPYLLA